MKRYLVVLTMLLTGCSSLNYDDGQTKFSRSSFGNKTSIGKIEVALGSNGVKTVRMEGYSNDQIEAIKIAVEAAIAAAVKSAVPVAP